MLVLVAAGAATIVASAVVHLYLWGKEDGYRAVPTIGPLFLLQGIAGCLLGPVMLVLRRVVTDAAGAMYLALSLGPCTSASMAGCSDSTKRSTLRGSSSRSSTKSSDWPPAWRRPRSQLAQGRDEPLPAPEIDPASLM